MQASLIFIFSLKVVMRSLNRNFFLLALVVKLIRTGLIGVCGNLRGERHGSALGNKTISIVLSCEQNYSFFVENIVFIIYLPKAEVSVLKCYSPKRSALCTNRE